MSTEKNSTDVVTLLSLNEASARKILDQICRDTARVFFDTHAEKQMINRGINRIQVMRCLRNGLIIEGPYREARTGNWRLKLETRSAGDIVTVVAELDTDDDGNYVLVITTW